LRAWISLAASAPWTIADATSSSSITLNAELRFSLLLGR
jgi:hypothetical protein